MKGTVQLLKHLVSSRLRLSIVLLSLLVIALTLWLFSGSSLERNTRSAPPLKRGHPYSWAKIRRKDAGGIVKIRTFTSGMGVPGTDSSGTGWLTKNGLIVTCYHVLGDKHYTIAVYPYLNGHNTSDKVWYHAKVITASPATDIAVLKPDHPLSGTSNLSAATNSLYVPDTTDLVLGDQGYSVLSFFMSRTGFPRFFRGPSQGTLVYSLSGISSTQTRGLSGAPIINRFDQVIGVLDISHAYNHNRVYMIPIADLPSLHRRK